MRRYVTDMLYRQSSLIVLDQTSLPQVSSIVVILKLLNLESKQFCDAQTDRDGQRENAPV